MRVITTAASTFLFLTFFAATANSEQVFIYGSGNMSCSEWTKARSGSAESHLVHDAWILGFVAGVKVTEEKNIGGDIESKAMLAWVDNFCRDQPFQKVWIAAGLLVRRLRSK